MCNQSKPAVRAAFLNVQDAAKYMGISVNTLYVWRHHAAGAAQLPDGARGAGDVPPRPARCVAQRPAAGGLAVESGSQPPERSAAAARTAPCCLTWRNGSEEISSIRNFMYAEIVCVSDRDATRAA